MSGYASVPQNDQEELGHTYEQPSLSQKYPILQKRSTVLLLATAAIALLGTSAYLLGASNELSSHRVHYEQVGISNQRFEEGLEKCKFINRKKKHQYPDPSSSRVVNARFVNGTRPTLFKNGHIFDGVNEAFKGDVLVDQGLIVQIGKDITILPKETVVVDLKGHVLTPGIVDMHSHLGVSSWPGLDATEDTNEMTQPYTPFIRSLDGFNPSDPGREWVLSGGVTTSLILPGSGNLIGGEAYALKLRQVDTLSNEDMLVEAGVDDKWRYMKMACGENPKRVYGSVNVMPSTRLGEGWVLRDQFSKATKLKDDQDDWCTAAENLPHFGRHRLVTPFPENPEFESLVGILRDDVRLNIHCYETHDLEAMVRHSNEFKFKISAFHHGLDAYRVPEILKRAYKHVPTVATFAGKFGYKKEAFQSSVNAPKILADAGIAVAMKSDHPVLNSQHLVYEAAQARHHGLSELLAIASVTSVPAKALGLDHRIGKIAIGFDADLVIWEKHPLALGAHPLQVYIDGIAQIENVDPKSWTTQDKPQTFKEYPELKAPEVKNACTDKAETAVFTGIKKMFLNKREEFSASGELTVVVDQGEIVCAGNCGAEVSMMSQRGAPVYDLGGEGVALPPIVSFGTPNLGLIEIGAEESTGDGHPNLSTRTIYAADGLKFGGRHLEEAYKAGVLTVIVAPDSEHVIQGVSVAFQSGAENALSIKDAILKENVALHVRIGQQSKSNVFPTVSSQIAFLREVLMHGLRDVHLKEKDEFVLAAAGRIPLVIEVDNRDEIIRLIQLKKDLERDGARLKVALLGAVEAWTVAEHLARADISVILRPYHCTPVQWTAQQCLPGAPLSDETGLAALYRAGVNIGLSSQEADDVRQLAWIAGWARSDVGISEKEAVGLITWNLADIVGLPTNPTSMVIYNGDPFEFGAKVSAIVGGGKAGVQCNPRAF